MLTEQQVNASTRSNLDILDILDNQWEGLGTPLIVWGVVAEFFDLAEIVAVHLIGKTVRASYLMGVD